MSAIYVRDKNGTFIPVKALIGPPGYSPEVNIEDIDGGHRVIIKDASGEKSFDVMDGESGSDGGASGADGKDGGYYTPSVSDGVLSWTGSQSDMPAVESVVIKGEDGKPGNDGVSPVVDVNKTDGVATITVTDVSGIKTTEIFDGVPGKNGSDGYTPVKGVDYFDGTNGSPGEDGFSPTVEVVELDGGHRVTITDADGAKVFDVLDGTSGAPFDAAAHGIPVLRLTGDTTGMSKETSVEMSFVMGERSGACTLKWQGTSSIYYPKKNYTIRFDEAFEAKSGWGAQSKYCLKAYWVDASYLRDRLGARIWDQVIKEFRNPVPEQLAGLPRSGAVDGFPVWVTINGRDQGLYSFNIPKDAWMFGMTGANAGEAIICSENSDFSTPAVCDSSDFTIEYSASEDTSGVIASFNRLIAAVNNVKSADDLPALEEVLDIDSAIDYYVLAVAIRHYDGIVKNGLFVTFDGVKWFMSPYDMDGTFGNAFDGSGYGWSSDWPAFTNLGDAHRLHNVLHAYYGARIKERYLHLRGWPLSESSIQAEAYKMAIEIPKVLLDEDYRLWPGRPGTLTNNVGQILSYTRLRLPWLEYNAAQLT